MPKLKDIVAEVVAAHEGDAYLVSVQGEKVVHVLVDTDAGITLGECSALNRAIRDTLEERLAWDGELEVSSPGIGTPLLQPRQYKSNIGRKLAIHLKEGQRIQGELLEVAESQIELGVVKKFNPKLPRPPKQEPRTLPFDEIQESKVILEYAAS